MRSNGEYKNYYTYILCIFCIIISIITEYLDEANRYENLIKEGTCKHSWNEIAIFLLSPYVIA